MKVHIYQTDQNHPAIKAYVKALKDFENCTDLNCRCQRWKKEKGSKKC